MTKVLAKYFAEVDGYEGDNLVEIVAQKGNIFTIRLNGKEYEVDYDAGAQNLYSFIINNMSYGVEISQKHNEYDIIRGADFFHVEILDEMKKYMKERVTKQLQGRQVITTMMPGLILKVFVEPGQAVKAGDPLLILEAMKMENEIKAQKDGVVQQVFVQANQVVAANDKLAIIE